MDVLKNKFSPKTRAIVVFLIMIVVFSGFKSKKVADKIKLKDWENKNKYTVQDLRTWGQGEISMPDKPIEMDGYTVYKYKLGQDLLEEYISAMEKEGFTLVSQHHQSSFLGSYQSYGLVCDKAKDTDTISQMYTHADCHINIWKDGSRWRVDVADGIVLRDMGLRRDGTEVPVLPAGESVAEGLKLKGKKYTTTDKRLKAKIGQTAVIADKKEYNCDTQWSKSGNSIEIVVNITDRLTAQINFKTDTLDTTRIYRLCSTEETPVTFKLSNGDKSISIGQTGGMNYHNVTVRPMYMDEDNNLVLYIYAEPMDTEIYPQSVEMLCTVNITPEKTQSGGGGIFESNRQPFKPDHSRLDCLTCDGSGDCNKCGGSTYVGFGDARAKCDACRGTGDCRTCGGSGKR